MKKILLFMMSLTFCFQLFGSDMLYKCANQDFDILVMGSSLPFEATESIDDRSFARMLFDNDISVKVTEGSNTYQCNIVASLTDGAGQDSFQAFSRDDSYLVPLSMKTDFYFEHEGGCLDGSVYSESQKKWITFDACWDDHASNRMMCSF